MKITFEMEQEKASYPWFTTMFIGSEPIPCIESIHIEVTRGCFAPTCTVKFVDLSDILARPDLSKEDRAEAMRLLELGEVWKERLSKISWIKIVHNERVES